MQHPQKFRPVNVGFGLTHILPVVTAVLASEPGDLIIIENPEAICILRDSLQSPPSSVWRPGAVQIITETHSDHFLNGIRVEVRQSDISPENVSLSYFSRDVDSREHAVEVTQLFDADGRIDEWDNNLSKLVDF